MPSTKKRTSSPKRTSQDPLYIPADLSSPYQQPAAEPSSRISGSASTKRTSQDPLYIPADLSSPYRYQQPHSAAVGKDESEALTLLDEGTYAVPVELEMSSIFDSAKMKSRPSVYMSNNRGAAVAFEEDVEIKKPNGRRGSIQMLEDTFYSANNDLYYATDDDIARKFYGGWTILVRIVRIFGINPLGIKAFVPQSAITDVTNFPPSCFWFIMLFQTVAFFALFVYFLVTLYSDGRTKPFVSLLPTSGDCTEIPTTLIGTYMVDAKGHWQTSAKFSLQLNNFESRLYSLRYTTSNWNYVVDVIQAQVKVLGAKTKEREMAYNIAALSSFAAVYDAASDSSLGLPTDSGTMIFYSTADPGTIFDKTIFHSGSFLSSYDGICYDLTQSVSYDRLTATVTLDVEIDGNITTVDTCSTKFSASLLGFETRSTMLTMDLNMNSIMTAVAVNLGIRPLASLIQIKSDSERITLLRNMRDLGRIGNDVLEGTSSYYDELLAPMAPIYCTTFTDLNSTSGAGSGTQCLVRIGNALLYPIVHNFGASWTKPSQCTKKKVKSSELKKFYCNIFDIMVGLVYYNETSSYDRTFETLSPTLAPSPQPGKPTRKPSIPPSPAPSRHTKRPTYSPTFKPSHLSPYNYNYYNYYDDAAQTYDDLIADDDYTVTNDDDYQRGLVDDDFQQHPFAYSPIDSGRIFGLLRESAEIMYDDPVNGDMTLMERFFELNFWAQAYNDDGNDHTAVFSKACSPNPACYVISLEFYDPFDKKLSTFLYQPTPTLAFTDVFYDVMSEDAFKTMKSPPSALTQPYYSCILTVGDAFNNALGVAKGNADLYLSLGITVVIFLVMASLNNIRRIDPPIKSLSTVFAEKEMFDPEEELRRSVMKRQAEIEILRTTVKSMQSKLDILYEYNTELRDDMDQLKRRGSKKY